MASGEQLKALLTSHADGDDDRFFSVAMQVAAHEARSMRDASWSGVAEGCADS